MKSAKIIGMREGREEGRAEGRLEGRAEGERNKQIEIARNLKKAGVSIDVISQSSGLTVDEIEKL